MKTGPFAYRIVLINVLAFWLQVLKHQQTSVLRLISTVYLGKCCTIMDNRRSGLGGHGRSILLSVYTGKIRQKLKAVFTGCSFRKGVQGPIGVAEGGVGGRVQVGGGEWFSCGK